MHLNPLGGHCDREFIQFNFLFLFFVFLFVSFYELLSFVSVESIDLKKIRDHWVQYSKKFEKAIRIRENSTILRNACGKRDSCWSLASIYVFAIRWRRLSFINKT